MRNHLLLLVLVTSLLALSLGAGPPCNISNRGNPYQCSNYFTCDPNGDWIANSSVVVQNPNVPFGEQYCQFVGNFRALASLTVINTRFTFQGATLSVAGNLALQENSTRLVGPDFWTLQFVGLPSIPVGGDLVLHNVTLRHVRGSTPYVMPLWNITGCLNVTNSDLEVDLGGYDQLSPATVSITIATFRCLNGRFSSGAGGMACPLGADCCTAWSSVMRYTNSSVILMVTPNRTCSPTRFPGWAITLIVIGLLLVLASGAAFTIAYIRRRQWRAGYGQVSEQVGKENPTVL